MKVSNYNAPKLFQFIVMLCGLTFGHSALAQTSLVATGCGSKQIIVADLQWPSASVLAHIHAQVISAHLDCKTGVVEVDIESATTTLKAAQTPTLIPEIWVTRVADKWNQVIEARAGFVAGKSFDTAVFEGWYIAPKVIKDFPALEEVANLKDIQALYQLAEKPEFISCPITWACSVLNKNMLKALGLWSSFKIVVPDNRLDMDRRIGAAVSSNKPAVFYYWQPNALVHDLNMTPIDLGPQLAEAFSCLGKTNCSDLKPTAFVDEKVVIALADWVRGDAPELLPYTRKAIMPMDVMAELLSVQVEGQLTPEQTATYFVVNYPQIWQNWLPKNE